MYLSNYFKKGLIISAIVGILVGCFYVIYCILHTIPIDWVAFSLLCVSTFGIGGVIFYVSSFFVSAEEIVTEIQNKFSDNVYFFYNAYINEMCRVERITYLDSKNQIHETNYVDKDGNLISSEWYDLGGEFMENSVPVYKDEKFALMDRKGVIISDWYDNMTEFANGYSKVIKNNGEVNFIDENGKLLWKEWKKEMNQQ